MKIFLIILGSIYIFNTFITAAMTLRCFTKIADYKEKYKLKRIRPLSLREKNIYKILNVLLIICPIVHIIVSIASFWVISNEQKLVNTLQEICGKEEI